MPGRCRRGVLAQSKGEADGYPRRSVSIDPPSQAGVACNKVPDVFGYWYAIDIAAGFNIFGYLVGNILDPVLKCVEGHDANRSVELAGWEIGDGRFEVVPLDLFFRAIT